MAVRPRFQRCFLQWLEEERHRLLVQPRVIRRKDKCLELAFSGLTPTITFNVTVGEINVFVEWSGVFWDLLYTETVSFVRSGGVYICSVGQFEATTTYPSREALWRNHLFEPFLCWINRTLAPASSLILYGSDDWREDQPEWSSARLWAEGDDVRFLDGSAAVLPLQAGPTSTEKKS